MLGLCCCESFSLVVASGGSSLAGVGASRCGGLSCCGAWARGCAGFSSCNGGSVVVAPRLESAGSVVVAQGLSCSMACGIFLDQGSNLCLLHYWSDSLPLSQQGNPVWFVVVVVCYF